MGKIISLTVAAMGMGVLLAPAAMATASQGVGDVVREVTQPTYVQVHRQIRTRVDAAHLNLRDASLRHFLARYVSERTPEGCHRVVRLEGYRADGWAVGDVGLYGRGASQAGCGGSSRQVFHREGSRWTVSLTLQAPPTCEVVVKKHVPRDFVKQCLRGDQVVPNPVK